MSDERKKTVRRKYYQRKKKRIRKIVSDYGKSKHGKAVRKKWRTKNFVNILLHSAKKRAKKSGLEFNLIKEKLFIPSKCPVFGTKFIIGNRKRVDFAPSLDRFDNTRGYTNDNVRVISFRANYLKRDATLKEMKQLVRYMSKKRK